MVKIMIEIPDIDFKGTDPNDLIQRLKVDMAFYLYGNPAPSNRMKIALVQELDNKIDMNEEQAKRLIFWFMFTDSNFEGELPEADYKFIHELAEKFGLDDMLD